MKVYAKRSIGSDVAEYQKWVDYDMERYGKVSDKTSKLIKKAGLSLVKDQYGDYEVIANEKDHDVKASKDDISETISGSELARVAKEVVDYFDYHNRNLTKAQMVKINELAEAVYNVRPLD